MMSLKIGHQNQKMKFLKYRSHYPSPSPSFWQGDLFWQSHRSSCAELASCFSFYHRCLTLMSLTKMMRSSLTFWSSISSCPSIQICQNQNLMICHSTYLSFSYHRPLHPWSFPSSCPYPPIPFSYLLKTSLSLMNLKMNLSRPSNLPSLAALSSDLIQKNRGHHHDLNHLEAFLASLNPSWTFSSLSFCSLISYASFWTFQMKKRHALTYVMTIYSFSSHSALEV